LGGGHQFLNISEQEMMKTSATVEHHFHWIIQGAAEITPTFRKITVGSPKQIVGCDPFR
jgi:hypothetical protein